MKFKQHDRVEVVSPPHERGMKGIVLEVSTKYCIVRITQAGNGHNTTKLIGEEITYAHTELKGI